MGAVDTCLCMGASVGMAGGLTRAQQETGNARVVATIGDSTFYHAGVPALINAVHTRASFVLVIMDNNITAMTGGQPTPATDALADGAPATPVSLERLVHGCGVDFLEVVDPYDHGACEISWKGPRRTPLTRTEVCQWSLPGVHACEPPRPRSLPEVRGRGRLRFVHGCVKDLECPAFQFVKDPKRMVIDEDLCAGCGYCVKTCPSQAVRLKGE